MLNFSKVKDERGYTYVAPLDHPVLHHTVTGWYETRPATHVMVWYNFTTRDWVVSYSSQDYGSQVGSSEYVYSRGEANDLAQMLWDEAAALPTLNLTA